MAKRWRTKDKANATESPRRGEKWKRNRGAKKTILRRRSTRHSTNVSENSPQSDDDVELIPPPTRGSVHNVTNALPTPLNHLWTSRSRDANSISPQLKEHVEWAISLAKDYEKYLENELEGTISAVTGHEAMLASLMNEINEHKQKIESAKTDDEKVLLRGALKELEDNHSQQVNEMTELSDEEKEAQSHLLEQLFDCRTMKEDFESILKKHDGHASRVLTNVMQNHGVDEQIYHEGAVIGNQCMTFAREGKEIVSDVNEEMKQIINTPLHVQYLDKLQGALDDILSPLYKILCVMKSVKKQTQQKIQQFKRDTIELNIAIHKFVEEPPVPDAKIGHPTFLKSHLLFDYHIQDFLERWGSLGAFSEENIESTHPIFNKLMRRYGNSRGRQLKRNVMQQFIIERSSIVLNAVDVFVTTTSTTKRPDTKKRGKVATDDSDVCEDTALYSTDLTEMEKKMNDNTALHEHEFGEDTCITACGLCGMRVLNFGLPIHNHEYHSTNINFGDVDNDVKTAIGLGVIAPPPTTV